MKIELKTGLLCSFVVLDLCACTGEDSNPFGDTGGQSQALEASDQNVELTSAEDAAELVEVQEELEGNTDVESGDQFDSESNDQEEAAGLLGSDSIQEGNQVGDVTEEESDEDSEDSDESQDSDEDESDEDFEGQANDNNGVTDEEEQDEEGEFDGQDDGDSGN